ncbi:transcriptional regulator with XRE-family HTH domain [Hamadaea flava]|uniref:Helix-turn-helix domain-containing protein n=1 Tax=Hamadaea flava TaxID=1742688 RepID=A0ABV8LHA1_9ACTN|nr:helix-turn-helix domain-containing protein [Hamadaea flava]MCP2325532.1 transcriptional regulator with XRE-family HTH domain [Hamadaea flava]
MDMGEVARRLRADDQLSIAQIRELLGVSRAQIDDWLRGVPVPEWTKRPNAKDELRARAVDLRRSGRTVPVIAEELGVARSTAWQWTKHIPLTGDPVDAERRRANARRMTDARWTRHRAERAAQRHRLAAESAARIGPLDDRDLLLLGSVVYWCAGAKATPARPNERVELVTADARLGFLFLRFLDAVGVARTDLSLRVLLQDAVDPVAAVVWWAEHLGARVEDFRAPDPKRLFLAAERPDHPQEHHGRLRIRVCHSRDLYRTIESVLDALAGPADVPDGEAR